MKKTFIAPIVLFLFGNIFAIQISISESIFNFQVLEASSNNNNSLSAGEYKQIEDFQSKRCQAITKAGTQCKRNAKEDSDYCWQHQNFSSSTTNNSSEEKSNLKEEPINKTSQQCQAITKAGNQCSRNAKEGSNYCWQHQNYGNTSTTQKSSSYSGDRTIYTGPRGGQYYINSKGNKTYIKKKK